MKEETLGLHIGDKIRYSETISPDTITEETLILRKEIAQKSKVEEAGPPTATETRTVTQVAGPTPSVGVLRKVSFRATVPWDRLSDLVRGVITPLMREEAEVSLEVRIDAESDKGISRDTIDLRIKETLRQIGARVLEEKEE